MNWALSLSSNPADSALTIIEDDRRRCVKHDNQAAMHTKMLVNLRYADRPYKDPHTFT